MPALAGANLIYGAGMLESGVTMDYGQLVLDNEIARMIKHVISGVPVDDETLAVDDIRAVGSHGDFLSLEATFTHMREQSQPQLLDRRVREEWQADGASDVRERSLARARRILEEHRPLPLPDGADEQLAAIIARTGTELGVAG